MKNKKRVIYLVTSFIIIIILILAIVIAYMNIYGKSSKQVRESYDFLHNLQMINAISKEADIKREGFQEVKRVNELSTVKFTLINCNYGVDLSEDYEVIGFSNQDPKKQYTNTLTELECVEYAKKYLNKIYKGDFAFKQIKDNDSEGNPFYTIAFNKIQNKYICYSSEILIKINKYNGLLEGYSNYSDKNVKYSSEISISEEKCKRIFNEYMNNTGFKGEIVGTPKIGYINIDGEENQLCYIIVYSIIDSEDNSILNDMVINANSGEIVKYSNNIVELISGE